MDSIEIHDPGRFHVLSHEPENKSFTRDDSSSGEIALAQRRKEFALAPRKKRNSRKSRHSPLSRSNSSEGSRNDPFFADQRNFRAEGQKQIDPSSDIKTEAMEKRWLGELSHVAAFYASSSDDDVEDDVASFGRSSSPMSSTRSRKRLGPLCLGGQKSQTLGAQHSGM